ncbi:MAG: efflux RND transporter permease subunit [Pseudomonadales bacterium]
MFDRLLRLSLEGTVPVLLLLLAFGLGLAALVLTPREEEPQIVVPSADVLIDAPGLDARQVERLVTTPLEKLLAQIDGVEHVYSTSSSGRAVVSVRFFVGEDREDSLLKLYTKVYSEQQQIPAGVTGWVVKPVEVDDVPILTATLWADDPAVGDFELRRLAEEVAVMLQAVPDTNRIEVIGGRPREFRVLLEPLAMAGRVTAIDDVLHAIGRSSVRQLAGSIDADNRRTELEVDARIRSARDLNALVVNVVDGVPVRLGDIATVVDAPAEPSTYTWIRFAGDSRAMALPAVNVSIAKRRGANAVTVADALISQLHSLEAEIFPSGVEVAVTRNYGATADQKISDLIGSLAVAVVVVVVLIGLTLGWRAALVVALAVPICYGFTLILDYAAGYTINRVTLFALILALGLLVDDPITGVDNIERHLADTGTLDDRVIGAMQEIRTPLIMSTIAVVIVFAPMSFITGMMGPYMSPMAFNVPVAVIVSTLVAFLVTPWLGKRILRPAPPAGSPAEPSGTPPGNPQRPSLYVRLLDTLLSRPGAGRYFLIALGGLFVASLLLPLLRVVPLKLLPYDNRNEFQLVIDAAEGTTLETTDGFARRLADYLVTVPEVEAVNAYVGTHAPMDFNGLVRRYYLRGESHQGELHVVLADKLQRPDQSHALILRLRPAIAAISADAGIDVKVVEVPPGPPVIASVVAEHYGSPTTPYADLIDAARITANRLAREPGVVDVDVSARAQSARRVFVPDQEKAALSGIGADVIGQAFAVIGTVPGAGAGTVAAYAAVPDEASPLPIRLTVPYADRDRIGQLFIKGQPGIAKVRERGSVTDAPTPLVSLAELGRFEDRSVEQPIFHKDLRPVSYAFAEVAGRVPADVVYDLDADLRGAGDGAATAGEGPADRGSTADTRTLVEEGRPLAGRTYFSSGGGLPWQLPADVKVAWGGEGEWNITLRVFRDLGIAFGVALLGLFVVIRAQTGLTALTFIIMLAIPLTVIGIMPGFWLLNLFSTTGSGSSADPVLFTATAMIGMIALAGIVVRNSLILVEFVQQARSAGMGLDDALLEAGRLRARPVLLTAGTTLLGNLVITLDPIFAGLAWAIIFGIAASTVFTLLVVPLVYKLVYAESEGGSDEVA